jgi:thiol:disulfide interchange protein DsbC
MKEQRDLTAERVEKAARIAFGDPAAGRCHQDVRGKGERVMAVFSDPDCPYCRRLESELDKLDNVTLYTFPYPLEGLHPEAKDKSIAVWCADESGRPGRELMKSGKAPTSRKLRSSDRTNYPAGPTAVHSGNADPAVEPTAACLPGAAPQGAHRAMAGGGGDEGHAGSACCPLVHWRSPVVPA